MRIGLRRRTDDGAPREPAPTERWTNPAGFAIWVPAHWAYEQGDGTDGWIPPSRTGRLSRLPVIATRERTTLTTEILLENAWAIARAVGADEVGEADFSLPDHLVAAVRGRSGGQRVFGLVHAWGEVRIAGVVWRTPLDEDPDEADAIQAAFSLTPLRDGEG